MPTSRNARGIDLLIYDSGGHYQGIQVKALSKQKPPVPLGKSTMTSLVGDWWIIVTNGGHGHPECFIIKPEEVSALAHRGVKDSRVSYWLQPRKYHTVNFARLGRGSDLATSRPHHQKKSP